MLRVPYPPCNGQQFIGPRPFYEDLEGKKYLGEVTENFHYVDDAEDLPFTIHELLQGMMMSSRKIDFKSDDCYDGDCMILCCWGGCHVRQESYIGKDGNEYNNICFAREGVWMKVRFETSASGCRSVSIRNEPRMIQMMVWDLDGSDLAIPWYKEISHEETMDQNWAYQCVQEVLRRLETFGFKVPLVS